MTSTRLAVTLNTASQFAGRIISSGTTFVLTILLARSLGTDGYGDFTKITTFVSFFYQFADFGMNAAFLQLKSEDKRFTFSHLLGLRIVTSIFLVFVCVSILSFFPNDMTHGYTSVVRLGIIIYSLSIVAQSLVTTINAIFQDILRYDLAMLAVIGGSLFRLVSTYIFGTGTVIGAISCFLLGAFVTSLIAIPLAKKHSQNFSLQFSMSHMLRLLKASLPLGITLVFNLIYFRIDSIILTLTQSTTDVGIYNLAYSFFEFALVIPIFFMNALYPIFLQRKSESLESFFSLAQKTVVVLFAGGLCTSVGMWISAPLITLIKPEFSPGVDALRVLSLSIPFFFLTGLTMWMLITLHRRKALILIYGFSMVLNIAANSFFIPRIGYMAAAWITLLGEATVLLLSAAVLLNERRQTIHLRRILTP